MRPHRLRRAPSIASRRRAGGAVALMVLALMLVLVAAAGLGVEAGRLYVNRAELQTAADACALAAAQRLNCASTDSSCLTAAETAGIAAAALNQADLQQTAVAVAASNITFATALDGTYSARGAGAVNNARFARCNASSGGLAPMLLGVVGIASTTVWAGATATLSPSSNFSAYVPLGICSTALSPTPAKGTWITLDTAPAVNNMRFIAGNTAAVNDVLGGEVLVTGAAIGSTLKAQTNSLNSVGNALNTRFGIYQGPYSSASASPPDLTGYAYPNQSPGTPVISSGNAFSNYNTRAKSTTASDRQFTKSQYAGPTGGLPGTSTASDHTTYGKPRRLVQTSILDCSSGTSTLTVTGMACVLLLNPLSNGASATLRVEYLGASSDPDSPCPPAIAVPNPSGSGPLVPTLVQ
jgi:Flp pilus assembly protein TadG